MCAGLAGRAALAKTKPGMADPNAGPKAQGDAGFICHTDPGAACGLGAAKPSPTPPRPPSAQPLSLGMLVFCMGGFVGVRVLVCESVCGNGVVMVLGEATTADCATFAAHSNWYEEQAPYFATGLS